MFIKHPFETFYVARGRTHRSGSLRSLPRTSREETKQFRVGESSRVQVVKEWFAEERCNGCELFFYGPV